MYLSNDVIVHSNEYLKQERLKWIMSLEQEYLEGDKQRKKEILDSIAGFSELDFNFIEDSTVELEEEIVPVKEYKKFTGKWYEKEIPKKNWFWNLFTVKR